MQGSYQSAISHSVCNPAPCRSSGQVHVPIRALTGRFMGLVRIRGIEPRSPCMHESLCCGVPRGLSKVTFAPVCGQRLMRPNPHAPGTSNLPVPCQQLNYITCSQACQEGWETFFSRRSDTVRRLTRGRPAHDTRHGARGGTDRLRAVHGARCPRGRHSAQSCHAGQARARAQGRAAQDKLGQARMIQDTLGQTPHTDKPSLVPVRFSGPKSLGYASCLLVTVRVTSGKVCARDARL